MKELLSADELSDLLTAVGEGDAPAAPAGSGVERRVQSIDFRKPSRLSRDQLRALQQLHDAAAVALSSALSDILHAPVEVSLVAVEAVTYGTFNSALPTPACIQTFCARAAERRGGSEGPGAEPVEGRGLLAMDIPLAFGIIERLLGGRGQALEQPRPLTDIEQAVVTAPLLSITERLAAAWGAVARVELRPEALEMSPKAAQIHAVQEVVVQIIFALGGEVCVGDLNVCLPLSFVEQLLPRAAPDLAAVLEERTTRADGDEAMRRAVSAAPVRVAAELGRARLSVLDLLDLQPGYVVRLDRCVDDPLTVTVERTPHLVGRPGLVGQKLGLRITDVAPQALKGATTP